MDPNRIKNAHFPLLEAKKTNTEKEN